MVVLERSKMLAACEVADEWLAIRRRVLRLPGIQAAVVWKGETLLDTAHGWADLDGDVALTPHHLFRIASHSKTFTATIVFQLYESGDLRLDDRVGQHLEWLKPPLADVTIRELISHGAGVSRDGTDADHWLLSRPFPDQAQLRESVTADLAVLPPNERFKYSNVGFALLGQVIETVAGRPFRDLVRERVADRLGLVNIHGDVDAENLSRHATGYAGVEIIDRQLPITPVATGSWASATGVSATAADTASYLAAHAMGDERLLRDASKRLAQREEWTIEKADQKYGLGFDSVEIGGRRLIGHSGGFPGYVSRSMVDPATGLAVSVAINSGSGPSTECAQGLVKLVDLACADEAEPDPALGRFTGAFANLFGRMDVVQFGGRLLGLHLNQPDPTENAVRFERIDDATVKVVEGGGFGAYGERMFYTYDDSGRVTGLRLPGGLSALPLDAMTSVLEGTERVELA